ncbi:MAG: cyclic nucleotide-binding domain-containing protein [Lentimonas sp.]
MEFSFNPLSDLNEVKQVLSRISFFGGVVDDTLEKMMPYFQGTTIKAGECIIRKGDTPTHIFILQSGSVELHITSSSIDRCKRDFGVGDHFGEVAMFSMINDTASFFAKEDCQLITFSQKSLARLSREEPLIFRQLILNLARDLARKVQYSDELMLRHYVD